MRPALKNRKLVNYEDRVIVSVVLIETSRRRPVEPFISNVGV